MVFKREINLVIFDYSIDSLFFRIIVFVENAPPTGANPRIPLIGVRKLFPHPIGVIVILGRCHNLDPCAKGS